MNKLNLSSIRKPIGYKILLLKLNNQIIVISKEAIHSLWQLSPCDGNNHFHCLFIRDRNTEAPRSHSRRYIHFTTTCFDFQWPVKQAENQMSNKNSVLST